MRREWWEEAQVHIWVGKVEVMKCGCQSLTEGSEWGNVSGEGIESGQGNVSG